MNIRMTQRVGVGGRGASPISKYNYAHFRTAILMLLAYLFGIQQEKFFALLDAQATTRVQDSASNANAAAHGGVEEGGQRAMIHKFSKLLSWSSWAANPEESRVGFWDDGWRSIEFFEGKRKTHPQEETKFFGEGQEQAVLGLLGKKRGGSFIDLASHQAVTLSNTYALERQFGWTGICIEANHVNLDDLRSMRTCQVVMAAVGNSTRMQPIDFAQGNGAGGLGGIVGDGMDNTHNKNRGRLKRYYTVPLLEVLERFQAPTTLDYLSLDIEGAEYFVMKNFDFDKYTFKIMTVERPEPLLMSLLHTAGYKIIKKVKYDVLYVHESALEEVRPNFAEIDVTGPYEDQMQTKWQLVPPVTTDPRFAT